MNVRSGICVLGSLNMDLVCQLDSFHKPGETVTARAFHTYTGGKGGNQAVAAAKLGQKVTMVGCVGGDAYGAEYKKVLEDLGVNTQYLSVLPEEPTGVALIEVDKEGENRIVVVPGANARVDEARALEAHLAFMHCGALLLQMETPVESAIAAAEIAHFAGATVILDPAPAQPIPERLRAACDYVTPNETELAVLTGMDTSTAEAALPACRKLIEMGAKAVINKRGEEGALLVTPTGQNLFFGRRVLAVDTTAAGDTFNAAFATGLMMGMDEHDAICFANGAAAVSVTGEGAQSAMPTLGEAIAFVE